MTDNSLELYDRFVAYLTHHAVGAQQAQTALTICGALALEPTEDSRRQLRACAQQASRCGVLVCSGQKGYYVPATHAETLACTAPLFAQSDEMRDRAQRLERLSQARFLAGRPALFALLEATA